MSTASPFVVVDVDVVVEDPKEEEGEALKELASLFTGLVVSMMGRMASVCPSVHMKRTLSMTLCSSSAVEMKLGFMCTPLLVPSRFNVTLPRDVGRS